MYTICQDPRTMAAVATDQEKLLIARAQVLVAARLLGKLNKALLNYKAA